MNIRQAKQQIERAMKAYFLKDEFGNYRLPTERQRPIFLVGAPGVGKTAIMEQIAQEMGVGFVSYSMTHHTRQSALGLPFIEKKVFDGVEYDVSEYTMSEIIASVYESMEETGLSEGILFLDEINCVSETLNPAMLQFLQYKIFGRHKVPDGWIVVTAGNPPEYNKTARDFDLATWDRMRRIDVEPDYEAWREFAVSKGVHPAVLTYLDIERGHFYKIEATVDGTQFVTARGWDDLSSMIELYEEQGQPVDELLIGQYVQNEEIAKRFAVYYELFTKYRSDYQVDRILEGQADEAVLERAKAAPFDERVSFMGLLVDALTSRVRASMLEEDAIAFLHGHLAALRDELAAAGDGREGEGDGAGEAAKGAVLAAVRSHARDVQGSLTRERANGLLTEGKYRSYEQALSFFGALEREAAGRELGFDEVRERFNGLLEGLDRSVEGSSAAIEAAFAFVERAFGSGQEMLLLVTDLSVNKSSMRFINAHGSDAYFAHAEALQFMERGGDLAERIKQLSFEDEQAK